MSSKNTSFKLAYKYGAVPNVNPALEAVENPSISPSENKSNILANCLEFKVSGARCGVRFRLPPPPEPSSSY